MTPHPYNFVLTRDDFCSGYKLNVYLKVFTLPYRFLDVESSGPVNLLIALTISHSPVVHFLMETIMAYFNKY